MKSTRWVTMHRAFFLKIELILDCEIIITNVKYKHLQFLVSCQLLFYPPKLCSSMTWHTPPHSQAAQLCGTFSVRPFFLIICTKGKGVARSHLWTWLCDNFTLLKVIVGSGKCFCSANFYVQLCFSHETLLQSVQLENRRADSRCENKLEGHPGKVGTEFFRSGQ